MNTIRDINPQTNSLTIEAGATLLQAQEAALSENRIFPLKLASEGSCTIGGILSTNAGGGHTVKYGTAKELVFGVEAVLASGEIWNGLTSLRKDNTGYDLNRLFLGAEGTLGIITAASLKLFPKPNYTQRVIVGLDNTEDAIKLLEECRIGNSLALFEVMPEIGYRAVIDNFPIIDPFKQAHPWYAVIDWEVDSTEIGLNIAESCLNKALEKGLINDALIAQNEAQAAAILSIREHMSAGQKHLGGSIKHDVSVPISKIPEFLTHADKAIKEAIKGCRPVGFGHFGDGNIHYNIAQPIGADKDEFLSNWELASKIVHDIAINMGGSFSAEHGIGIMKRGELERRADPVKLNMMRAIKTALDPDNLFNPRVMIKRQ